MYRTLHQVPNNRGVPFGIVFCMCMHVQLMNRVSFANFYCRNTKINERSTERSTFANERSTFANERSTFVNECSTFVSSGSDLSDEPIYDVPVVCHYNYNADGHHRGYNAQAPVGHENDVEQRQRYEQVHSHEPSVPTRREHGYGSMQSSDYETQRPVYAQIYHHEEDSGRYHEVQHS